MKYIDFLKGKTAIAKLEGFTVKREDLPACLMEHQKDAVIWALRGGCRAIFAQFGLGKTADQLAIMQQIVNKYPDGGKTLIVIPLGVKQEFFRDAENLFHMKLDYVRTDEEVKAAGRYCITNYERVRDGQITPEQFLAISLDEASILRGYGTKTFQEMLKLCRNVKYKFVATATPSPNEYKELIHYAGFLGVMDTGEALTRFFKRDSEKAGNLTLFEHKEQEFWLWVSSWALFVQKPSDLGYSDEGYDLPPLNVIWHKVDIDHLKKVKVDRDGQQMFFHNAAASLPEAAREKRDSIDLRVEEMMKIIKAEPEKHFILWHHLEKEREAIEKALPEAESVYGDLDLEIREKRIIDFSDGKLKYLATKPELSGSGCNFQRHCSDAIFIGIDAKFNDFIQAVHRIQRFQQKNQVNIHIIYVDSEESIKSILLAKWKRHRELTEILTGIIKKYGLSEENIKRTLRRSLGIEREEFKGHRFTLVNNDCVEEAMTMPENSVDLICTSIPFSNHYEYCASYNDFGHNTGNDTFFEQMDFLTPELLRILKPGRVAAIHVKDRIMFGNVTGTGFPTLDPFHMQTTFHFMKHGFQFFGMITIETDVVRENNQTYRLGWTEQCKDGSKMGVGCPEYLLLFRKLPTDHSKGYADLPVTKSKTEYTRGQWQIDARAKWNSSGNRLLTSAEVENYDLDTVNAIFSKRAETMIYDYEQHLAAANAMDERGRLPATFETFRIPARTPWVWDDVCRMRTLNCNQTQRGAEKHVCLASGTLILTQNGYTPIEEINVGDITLTHTGAWKRIIAKQLTRKNADVVKVNAIGVPNLICTPDHRIWARSTGKAKTHPNLAMSRNCPKWTEAKDLTGHYVNLKLPEVMETELSILDCWLIGRYLADGHFDSRNHQVFISVGNHKIKPFKAMAGKYIGAFRDNGSCTQFGLVIKSKKLRETIRKCGRGAEHKRLPMELICLDRYKAASLLDGYLSGDGHCTQNGHIICSSVSRAMLLGLAMLVQRAYGKTASIYAGRPERESVIEGRKVHCRQEWIMTWTTGKYQFSRILEDGAWKPVKAVESAGKSDVWNIRVEDDASYTAEGCIVKNCPLQFDIVERVINRWSNPGELVFDPFCGIGTVPYCAIKLNRRGYGSELNTGYWQDSCTYCTAMEQEIEAPTLFDMEQYQDKQPEQ